VGEVPEPMPLMASAHLMMLPSLWEGLPCAVLEACALGTPVLASDLPGTRELAPYFPHLHLMSLHQDDEEWAAAAEEIINAPAPGVADATECLARSPLPSIAFVATTSLEPAMLNRISGHRLLLIGYALLTGGLAVAAGLLSSMPGTEPSGHFTWISAPPLS
jgi:hypothetical protein